MPTPRTITRKSKQNLDAEEALRDLKAKRLLVLRDLLNQRLDREALSPKKKRGRKPANPIGEDTYNQEDHHDEDFEISEKDISASLD